MPRSIYIAVRLALLAISVAGCRSPPLPECHFLCTADTGCPSGMFCSNGSCGSFGSKCNPGKDGSSCTTCADQPHAGEECNLYCNTGCSCSQKCNVTRSGPHCVDIGTKATGESCMLTNGGQPGFDDCFRGLVCLREACGVGVNRCYRLCTSDDECAIFGTNIHCGIPVETGNPNQKYKACDVQYEDCDPINQTGCSVPFSCFLKTDCPPRTSCLTFADSHTLCDCPATVNSDGGVPNEGDFCKAYSDCNAGMTCVNSTCRSVCTLDKGRCPANRTCTPAGPTYGVCLPDVTDASAMN